MPRVRQDLIDRQRVGGFVTVAEASLRSGVCERTLRTWTRSGTLMVRRLGPMLVFVEVASLDAVTGAPARGIGAKPLGSNGTAHAKLAQPVSGRGPARELTLERDE